MCVWGAYIYTHTYVSQCNTHRKVIWVVFRAIEIVIVRAFSSAIKNQIIFSLCNDSGEEPREKKALAVDD